ncbi:flagellar motor switch protein FliN [Arthrobacter echini]|uniref:Flagellar motor switch protein FliN n=1 Tax=Arthrobacter echini TaxID=1529066 RepID=A0A4S5E121_9MICC|nr:flagellar motor switch protein FliN [Arthrobacter echini]THJ65038.1 flagellar motor switch protein FliN [Arthrobacter echini]
MNTTTAEHEAAAALAARLPLAGPVTAESGSSAELPEGRVSEAVVASFVGAVSADLAVVLLDTQPLAAAAGTPSSLVSPADVLMPALEAASAALGDGVLGSPAVQDAAGLFHDAETSVFRLAGHSGTVGWFAVRLRGARPGAAPRRSSGSSGAANLGRISNVEMAMTVEIGRTRMSVRDVLDLEPGAVIELDRSAGAPADVLLNGRVVAHGEVVVVDQDYAVRITQILDVPDGAL